MDGQDRPARVLFPWGIAIMCSRHAVRLMLALALPAASAAAQVCHVPSERSSIRAAVLDPACKVVQVASGSHVDSVAIHRSVRIEGASAATTIVRGRLLVRGNGAVADLEDIAVDARGPNPGCYNAIEVASGASVRSSAVVAVNGLRADASCPLFADSFDYGL